MVTFTLSLSARTLHSQAITVDTLQFSGPSKNRVDIVFFGDGWVQSEAAIMKTELQSHITSFFKVPDYVRYKKFFNIYIANHYRVKPAGNLQTKANFQYYIDAILGAVPGAEPKYIVSHNGNSGEGGMPPPIPPGKNGVTGSAIRNRSPV